MNTCLRIMIETMTWGEVMGFDYSEMSPDSVVLLP